MSYDNTFVPEDCAGTSYNTGSSKPAFTVGGGFNFDEVYAFAHAHDVTYIEDRVLQFKVVTPDVVLRTTNACQNVYLWWALRSGGGGTFGVVMESTSLVEPVMPIAVASISLPKNATKDNQMQWLEVMVDSSLGWAKEEWGGQTT
ncbi:hypothetical protein B0A55_10529 [Friedmanniomyces simplex]|uniref:FAD linked oxidase N-terminal domain-containing protein n=1 Tax=Friedmanniomyces simplex TaxID=329884 RepID=A0A4U0WKU3_9PEZI|nr:hypothetical protein B0A55_10529 [Friedmanniomyces simplex]